MRKHLKTHAMFTSIYQNISKAADHRAKNRKIPLVEVLKSGFSVFSLKDPSMLTFEKLRCGEPESLHGMYGIQIIPCESQNRTSLDTQVRVLC